MRDLRFAVRGLVRAPLLTVTSVLTLALGLGLAIGVLTVVYGVLFRPLPYAAPEQLVVIAIHRRAEPASDIGVKLPQVDEWRRRSRAFAAIAGVNTSAFTLRGPAEPRSVRVAMVTDGFFDLLGVPPAEGSVGPVRGTAPASALSKALASQLGPQGTWREGGFTLGTHHFSASAIMPASFVFPVADVELWVPADAVPKIQFFRGDDQRDFRLLARLAPGVTVAQAQDDARRVAEELNAGLTDPRKRFATVTSLDTHLRRDAARSLGPFAAGAALVLLIACANVSGLLVGRTSARRHEFAVRRALGAGNRQLLVAAFAESSLLALAGWALGIWLAHLVIRVFIGLGSSAIANVHNATIDSTVVIGSLGLVLLVALGTGVPPAIRALWSEAGSVLKTASPRTTGVRLFRGGLVVTQVALTIVLLVSAGLLTRTVARIVQAERGFDLRQALTMRLTLAETVRFSVAERAPFVERLVQEVRQLPGVVAAGVGSDLPAARTQIMMTIRVVRDGAEETFPLSFAAVTPGYLEAVGATLVQGRLFEAGDRLSAVPLVVVTETAVRKVMARNDPVGREWPATIPTPNGNVRPRIIGVVRDVDYGALDREAPAGIFVGWERVAPSQSQLVVRTSGDPAALAPALARLVRSLDQGMPLFPPKTLEEVVDDAIADRRLRLQLAAVFAALALVLAAIALWGAVAQTVLDRRRELAIRMALGSTATEAVRLMLRWGALLVLAGVVLGAAGAAASARTLRHLLVDVAPFDPLTFAAGIGVATLVSLLACYLPARRAATISPSELLRDA